MKIFTPAQPGMASHSTSFSALSSLAPMKKAWSHQARPSARFTLSAMASGVVVDGLVLGISKMAVTPPRTAPRVPLSRSSLCSRPGSRK